MPLDKLSRAPLLHQTVQDAIKSYIVEAQLLPGDALAPEGVLAERLGVSRNSVREAIKGLESIGILESQRGRGVFVRAFSFSTLIDNLPYGLLQNLTQLEELLDIRQALEEQLVARAIERGTAESLNQLKQALSQMASKAEQGQQFSQEDRKFHHALLAPVANETLNQLLDIFWQAFQRASTYAQLVTPTPLSTYKDHAAIVRAIERRDVNQAREALTQHYQGIRERLSANRLHSGSRPLE